MGISEVDRLERTQEVEERLRSRARHLPFGEIDRRIMIEAADLLEELRPLFEPKPKVKSRKKNVKG